MSAPHNVTFSDRLKASSDAKRAQLEKFQPRPTVTDPSYVPRAAREAAELERVRAERAEAKAEAKRLAVEAENATRQSQLDNEAQILATQREARKERKALTKAEAKAKRDARYAARKARQ